MADTPSKRLRTGPPAWIVTLLPNYIGCGKKKLLALANKFGSEEALRAASYQDLCFKPVGPTVAQRVRDFLQGHMAAPARSDGRPVIEMWNTLTKRKCPHPSCPKTEEDAESFIQRYPYYERYDGQDQEKSGVADECGMVDDDDQLTREGYSAFCRKPSVETSKQQLEQTILHFKLQLGPMYVEVASGSAAPAGVPPLFQAVSHANTAYGGTIDARTLQVPSAVGGVCDGVAGSGRSARWRSRGAGSADAPSGTQCR